MMDLDHVILIYVDRKGQHGNDTTIQCHFTELHNRLGGLAMIPSSSSQSFASLKIVDMKKDTVLSLTKDQLNLIFSIRGDVGN